jgi:hypothetical protein
VGRASLVEKPWYESPEYAIRSATGRHVESAKSNGRLERLGCLVYFGVGFGGAVILGVEKKYGRHGSHIDHETRR